MRTIEDMKSWLGAEPFLGIVTLAIVLPLAGLLGYMVIESALSASAASLVLLGIVISAFFAAHFADRVRKELGRKILQIYCFSVWSGFLAWNYADELIPWPGFTWKTVVTLFLVALWLYLLASTFRHRDEIDALPDYREK